MTPFAGWGFIPDDIKPLIKYFKSAKLCRGTEDEPQRVRASSKEEEKTTLEKQEILLDTLKDGYRSVAKIAEVTGFTKTWIQANLTKLAQKGIVQSINYRSYKHFYLITEKKPKGDPYKRILKRTSQVTDDILNVMAEFPDKYLTVKQLAGLSGHKWESVRKRSYEMHKKGKLLVKVISNPENDPANPTVRAFKRKSNE